MCTRRASESGGSCPHIASSIACRETTEDLVDAQFALMSLELRKLYAGLVDWFGLAERE